MKKITVFVILFSILFFYFLLHTKKTSAQKQTTFWQYQCIDTMKISRDKARAWANNSNLQNEIDWEMNTIASLGANCVAIDTPYDDEFLPYLTKWVQTARQYHLHIWFRGNFSGWEEWFNYSKLSSTQTFLNKLHTYITAHPTLFADEDIFTGAPEAEDGGPFNQVDPDEYASYRKFLIDEQQTEQQAFDSISVNVQLNWQSMNGGLAKRMLDQDTANNLGKVITIDHYVKTPQEMGEFITYFKNNFDTNVVIGEFGAPIPDINGPMTEDQQAAFVEALFAQLYAHQDAIVGINYWDLYDGSTALMNPDRTPRKVAQVVKKYFSPAVISGTVRDKLGDPLSGVTIKTSDGLAETKTDNSGKYVLTLVANPTRLVLSSDIYTAANTLIAKISPNQSISKNFVIEPKSPGFLYKLRLFLKGK